MAVSDDIGEAVARSRASRERVQQSVPDVGDAWRWYDVAQRLQRLSYKLPKPYRRPRFAFDALNRLVNIGYAYHQHAENVAWDHDDPMYNLHVPTEEHVQNAGLWVVELFPPSEFSSLTASIHKNAWDNQRQWLLGHRSNEEFLNDSRITRGVEWWDLATIADVDSNIFAPDATRETIPAPFQRIDLRAIHVGAGLTAVVAHFRFKEISSGDLDSVLHGPHEPRLIHRNGKRPLADNRLFSAYRTTQEVRATQHDTARAWMKKRCPGFFASHDEPQLLLDLLLFDSSSPFQEEAPSREAQETIRALGIENALFFSSESLPQLALSVQSVELTPGMPARNTWTLWGNSSASVDAAERLDVYGEPSVYGLGEHVGRLVRSFLVKLSLSTFIDVSERLYSTSRDEARVGHRSFTTKSLDALRAQLLTLSLDITSITDDVKAYWSREYATEPEIEFSRIAAPWLEAAHREHGQSPFPPWNFNDHMRKEQLKRLRMLRKADAEYRGLLATVASLGASIDASRLGRRALWASVASLAVAVVAVLSASVTDSSIGADVWMAIQHLLSR